MDILIPRPIVDTVDPGQRSQMSRIYKGFAEVYKKMPEFSKFVMDPLIAL